jgi:hypothetical protein
MKLKLLLSFFYSSLSSSAQKKQTIGFKENKGQIIDQNGKSNDAVKYLLNSRELNVQLKGWLSYDVYDKNILKQRIEKERSLH